MRNAFATTSNVERFLKGIEMVQERGAMEACMLLVCGEAGYGKTATVKWWAIQHDGVYLRAKASWTPHWAMAELAQELGVFPEHRTEKITGQIIANLAQHPRAIVIDEAEHALHDAQVLESFRDLTDLLELPLILVGMTEIQKKINRFKQFASRIADVAPFLAACPADVRICCDTLCETKVKDDLVAEIHSATAGRVREIINAISRIEAIAKRSRLKEIGRAEMVGQILTHDWQAGRGKVVKAEGKGVPK